MFQYDDHLLTDFPNTVGGVIAAEKMVNVPTSAALWERYQTEQKLVKERLGSTSLSEIPSLAAWRSTFSAFGVAPTKYRSAAEALLRRLTKKGDIPSINTLVDIGNLVSIRYGIPAAIFDLSELSGMLTVRYADSTERYTELGSDEIVHPEKGEVIFADDSGLVHARRWCWKQSRQSAATEQTTDTIIVTEAQHHGGIETVNQALSDLLALLKEHTNGSFRSGLLTNDNPRFEG